MNVVFRSPKSFSGPPEPESKSGGPGPTSPILAWKQDMLRHSEERSVRPSPCGAAIVTRDPLQVDGHFSTGTPRLP